MLKQLSDNIFVLGGKYILIIKVDPSFQGCYSCYLNKTFGECYSVGRQRCRMNSVFILAGENLLFLDEKDEI